MLEWRGGADRNRQDVKTVDTNVQAGTWGPGDLARAAAGSASPNRQESAGRIF